MKKLFNTYLLAIAFLSASFAGMLTGCGFVTGNEAVLTDLEESQSTEDIITSSGTQAADASDLLEQPTEETIAHPVILDFVDAHGNSYQVDVRADWEKHNYAPECFVREGDVLSYSSESDGITSQIGVDVSYYQGKIDWDKVKAAGYEFAFIRIGFRGYGEAGKLCPDKRYEENLKGAMDAGLDVGVYFFSQAISEEEAVEEAEYVLQLLEEADVSVSQLTLPVVFDPENILNDVARTDNVTGEQFTKNAIAFCERIKAAGCDAMVYSNMLWEAYKLDLGALSDYPVWYADYEEYPQTPYAFDFWQYSESAHVDGISEAVDVNIRMIQE